MNRRLLDNSQKLVKEAASLPQILGASKLLKGFEEWVIIGSTKLGVVFKPDLDFRLWTRENIRTKANQLVESLIDLVPREKIRLKEITPELVGVQVTEWVNPQTGTKWNLDFGVCTKSFYQREVADFEKLELLLETASEEEKELILRIKKASLGKKDYEWGCKIYQAVLIHKARSCKEYFSLVRDGTV